MTEDRVDADRSADPREMSRRELEDEVRDLRRDVAHLKDWLFDLEDVVYGEAYDSATAKARAEEAGGLLDRLDAIADETVTEADLVDEQQTRDRRDAEIERKLGILAEELDVDLSAERVAGADTITRVLRYGPDEVETRAYPVHYRARDVLANAGDWGTIVEDAQGRRFTITGGEARQRLRDKRDETLSHEETRRVFEKIVDWASSARRASVGKTDAGENRLVLYIEREGDDGG